MTTINIGRVRPVPKGAWNATDPFTALDIVTYGGGAYIATQNVPANTTPSTNPDYWAQISEKGAVGPQGPQGEQGPTGAAGADGVDGAVGETGPMGPSPSHQWNDTQLRFQNPDGSWGDYTNLIGPQGVQGPEGVQGPQGEQGVQGETGATGPQGPTGSQGPQGIQGVKGNTGATGPQGPEGPAGTTDWNGITNKPSTFTPATHSHSWSTITSKPTTFAPSAHTHTPAEAGVANGTTSVRGVLLKPTLATGNNGYWKCNESGVVIQWGQNTTGAAGYVTVTFPVAFPSDCKSVCVTQRGDVTKDANLIVYDEAATSFVCRVPNQAMNFHWIAIGY